MSALLSRHTPRDPVRQSAWLLSTGHNGLSVLARYGDRLLDLLHEVQPPAADVLLIDEILEYDSLPAELYKLIVTYGLPRSTWPTAAAMLSRAKDEEVILLHLWDAASSRLIVPTDPA